MSNIHPQAYIEEGAEIGQNVTIEPFAVIKSHVKLHDHVTIKSHCYIDGHTTIGEGTIIWPGASIGTKTQDLKFRGEVTYVTIGKHCEVREYATINSSCQEGSTVRVGDHVLIMAYCHVAHNCDVGNHVIMSNGSMLAGHVTIEDYAIIGGMTPIHQFSRIGCHAMVGGLSRVAHDIPPFTLGAGSPYRFGGLNMVGLKRRRFSLDVRRALGRAFKLTYRSGLHLDDALDRIESEVPDFPEVRHWIAFCRSSKRGLTGLQRVMQATEEDDVEVEELVEQKRG